MSIRYLLYIYDIYMSVKDVYDIWFMFANDLDWSCGIEYLSLHCHCGKFGHSNTSYIMAVNWGIL